MSKIDIERVTQIMEEILNARADLAETENELDEFKAQLEKIEDQIEGREDDQKSSQRLIEDLEEQLLQMTREEDTDY